jgi:hypothetical protein
MLAEGKVNKSYHIKFQKMSTRVLLLSAIVLFIGELNVCAQVKNFSLNQGQTEAENYYTQIPYQDINGKIIIEVSLFNLLAEGEGGALIVAK